MKKKDIFSYKKKVLILSDELQLNINHIELEHCISFIKRMDFFWSNLKQKKEVFNKKKKKIHNYNCHYNNIKKESISFEKLKKISLNFYNINLNISVIKNNLILDENNYVVIRNKNHK